MIFKVKINSREPRSKPESIGDSNQDSRKRKEKYIPGGKRKGYKLIKISANTIQVL